jgi:hypothetical protein
LKQMLNWTQQSPIILILPWDVKGNALLTWRQLQHISNSLDRKSCDRLIFAALEPKEAWKTPEIVFHKLRMIK